VQLSELSKRPVLGPASWRLSTLSLMSDHRPLHELRRWLGDIRDAPSIEGRVELIVRRPAVEAREVITHGELCVCSATFVALRRGLGVRPT
jgi:hypothetical protein